MAEPNDPMPLILAEMDQAISAMPVLARYARATFDAFKGEDFTDAQALELTLDRLRQI